MSAISASYYLSLVLDLYDGAGNPITSGAAELVPSVLLTDATDQQIVPQAPVTGRFSALGLPVAPILACDSTGPLPTGWAWNLSFPGVPGNPASYSIQPFAGPVAFSATDAAPAVFTFSPVSGGLSSLPDGTGVQLSGGSVPGGFIAGVTYFVVSSSEDTFELAASSGGSPMPSTSAGSGELTVVQCNLSALTAVQPEAAYQGAMTQPLGTPAAGQVPVATGSGQESEWGTVATNPMTATGDVIIGGASGAPTRLAGNISTTPEVLASTGTGGAANAPSWQTLAALGAISNPLTTPGDTVYGGTSGALTRLPGNTSAVQALLAQTGTGTASAAPVWMVPAAVTLPPPTGVAATDTAAIQDAENALSALGGGTILFQPGTYVVTGLTKHANVRWQGAERIVTTIRLAAAANADVVQGASFTTLTGTGSLAGITAWSIRDMTIDGNRSAQTAASWGLRVYGYDFQIERVSVVNCWSDGMWTEWGYSGSPTDSMESLYIGVKCSNNGGWGWHNRGPHDSIAHSCVLWDNNQAAGTAGNLWCEDDRSSQHYLGNLEAVNCHSYGASANWGVICDTTMVWVGGNLEGATYGQMLVRGSLVMAGCDVYYNAPAANTIGAGIQLGDDGSTPGLPSSFSYTATGVRISGTGFDNFAGVGRSSAPVAWVSCGRSSVDVHCNPQPITVAAGSNGQSISSLTSGKLLVSSTAGQPASGTIYVACSGGYAQCAYTSVTGGGTPSYNGVTYLSGPGGTVATGGAVAGDPLGGTTPDQYSSLRIDQGTPGNSGIRGLLSVQQVPGPVTHLLGNTGTAWQLQGPASQDLVNLNTSTPATPQWQFVGTAVQGWTSGYGALTSEWNPATGAIQPGTAAGAGASVYSGAGAPTISGSAGDLYIRDNGTTGSYLYRCSGGTSWTAIL